VGITCHGRAHATDSGFYDEGRKPEQTVLYQVIREHLETFLARAAENSDNSGFPALVVKELRRFLGCQILANGFTRFRCADCGAEKLVAHSCKGRGFCPSCGGRRMSSLAAHLVDHVIPMVPTRQWVLSLPIRIRYLLAYSHDLCREVLAIFNRVVNQFYRQQAKIDGIEKGNSGSIVFIQRSGGSINLNVHFDSTVLDGVFYEVKNGQDKEIHFRPANPPDDTQMAVIVSQIRYEVLCHLRDQGLLDYDVDSHRLAEEAPLLAACYDASVQNRIAFGDRAGQRVTRLGNDPYVDSAEFKVKSRGKLQASLDGFDLHARHYIPASDRKQLERALRYCARPPISNDRLELLPDGRVRLKLKTPYSDGTTYLALEPQELLEKLVALIPRPRVNLLIYSGVLAPNAKLRKAVVAFGREPVKPNVQELLAIIQAEPQPGSYLQALVAERPPTTRRNYTWAQLMQRVFEVDVLACDCGGRLRFIACITKPEAITAILRHLGLPDTPPQITPARSPPVPDSANTLFDVTA
jgi:hypothetical protein